MKKSARLIIARTLHRVDVQVSLLAIGVTLLASLSIFGLSYFITYREMLRGLAEQVNSIYSYTQQYLSLESFSVINSHNDIESELYIEVKTQLERAKRLTGVQYLYTAKRADDGQLIYVIDGLSENSPDFRYPGDLIEPEIINDLERALEGEKVMPRDILHTDWGDIFIAYLPINDSTGVTRGAMGVEFSATHQYQTYSKLRTLTPLVIFLLCSVSVLFSIYFFRRLSNPRYSDLATKDWLTGLKNRNAYELDARNLWASNMCIGLILADLNGLKAVNDTFGHAAGDTYIKVMANSLSMAATGDEMLYRIGGDEFTVIIPEADENQIEAFLARLSDAFESHRAMLAPNASYSVGYSIRPRGTGCTLEDTYHKSDEAMYDMKKNYYAKAE